MRRQKICSRNRHLSSPVTPLLPNPPLLQPLRPNKTRRSSPSTREIKAMIKTLNISRVLSLGLVAFGIMLTGGLTNASAQRDPFEKAPYARPKPVIQPGMRLDKDGKPMEDWSAPTVEQRIDYYKRARAAAASNGASIPKVTSVMTLDELAVIGIFRTPRGYAATVEATPIKLSYTIYPGEKFFDGQLVAVEENQLIFRRVTKVGAGKFVSSVENKALRQYTEREQIQGTAPLSETEAKATTPAQPQVPGMPKVVVAPVVSPLEEMNRQVPTEAAKTKPAKATAKPV